MNREFLEKLELDKEVVDKIMAEHGKTVGATNQELESVTTERDDLKEQLAERDEQLNDLSDKAKDSEELTAEIDRLKDENKTATTDLQNKLDQQAFDFTLEKALSNAKVRNPKAVKALLDTETIKLDGDKLLNLDGQLEELKESDAYLFEEEGESKPPTIVAGGNPNGGTSTDKSITEMNYEELADLKANDPAKFAELTK